MSFYPIISRYDIDDDLISLSNTKSYNTEKKAVNFKTGEEVIIKRFHTQNNINYKYDRVGVDSLCVMTQFLKIATVPVQKKGQIYFCVDISTNTKLKALFIKIFNILKNVAFKEHPTLTLDNVKLPLTHVYDPDTKSEKEYVNITLQQFDKKITTPIHYHRTKKQGNGLITISHKQDEDFIKELTKEMTLFKYPTTYGKKRELKKVEDTNNEINEENKQHTPTMPVLHYEGKFTLCFNVEYLETKIGENEKHEYCKINIYAKEVETKYNVSHVKSVLDIDVTNLNKQNTKQPKSISI